jgi:hypothetical protein
MQRKIEYDRPEYIEMPVPDPKGPYGHSLIRHSTPPQPARVSEPSELPRSILVSQERWELHPVVYPEWIEYVSNEKESYGHWKITRWYTWIKVFPETPEIVAEREKVWKLQEELLELRAYAMDLEQRLQVSSQTNLAGLYREMLREEAQNGSKKDSRTD